MPDFLKPETSKKGRKINISKIKTGNTIADSIIKKKLNHVAQK
jgi:hypothetical protein